MKSRIPTPPKKNNRAWSATLSYTVLCTTGLEAEAKIARRAGLSAVVGAGDHRRTVRVVEEAAPAAECLVSFGIAGALKPGLRAGDIILSTEVVDEGKRWLTSDSIRPRISELAEEIGAIEGPVLGARMVVATKTDKRRAWKQTGALAVDLESVVVARAAAALGIPFIVLRAIADPAVRELPPAALVPLSGDGTPAIGQVLASVLARPRQLPTLLTVAREARQALQALVEPAYALNRMLAGA
ncbi:MAG TPA: hopanoid-associated phosphorylase [Stellaceae bacterium]|nr:hopanoid-associated phosphorylase [Stellaceae bacterium]